MRREELYLQDILDACEMTQKFLHNLDRPGFLASELHQAAVLQKLLVIGEAAARLPSEFRTQHPEVEWRDIVAFRNIAVHAYFSIQWDVVWATAQDDVPILKKAVETILSEKA